MLTIQHLKFLNYFNNFGADPPYECKWMFGVNYKGVSGVYLRRCHLKLLLPYGSTLTKKQKQTGKNKKQMAKSLA